MAFENDEWGKQGHFQKNGKRFSKKAAVKAFFKNDGGQRFRKTTRVRTEWGII